MKAVENSTNITYNTNLRAPCSNLQCRIIIMIMAIILVIVGFVLFIVGCLLIWSTTMIESYVKNELLSFLQYSSLENEPHSRRILLNALLEYTAPLGRILFWIGIAVFAICGLGLYGMAVQNRFILFLVAAMLLAKILVISIMIATFHVHPDSVVNVFRDMAFKAVKGYRSMISNDPHSMVVSLIMPMLRCCGMNNGEDFAGSIHFERKLTSGDHILYINYPFPCCKLKETYEPMYHNCPRSMNEQNSNIKTGCWPILEKHLQSIYSKASYIVIFTTLGELALACLLIYLTIIT